MSLTELRLRMAEPKWRAVIEIPTGTWTFDDVYSVDVDHGVLVVDRMGGREAYAPGHWLEVDVSRKETE